MIGLGAMGAPMARHVARGGLLECLWNRSGDKARSVASEFAVPIAESPADLARRCNVIVICVSADPDVLEVVEACLPGLRSGTVLVDASTVNPATDRKAAAIVADRGTSYVDAPVSGGVEGAEHGRLAVMAGGKSADISRIRPVLEAFSASISHMGEVGAGQATKAVNQVIVGGVAEAVCEALALAEKLNLPSKRLIKVLGAGAAGSWFLEHRGQSMLESRFSSGFKSALLLKDLRICRELARDLDMNAPMVEAAIRDYDQVVEAGDGDDDISVLIRLKRDRKGSP